MLWTNIQPQNLCEPCIQNLSPDEFLIHFRKNSVMILVSTQQLLLCLYRDCCRKIKQWTKSCTRLQIFRQSNIYTQKKLSYNPPNWTTHIKLETKSHIEEMQVNEVTFLRVCCIFEICKNQLPPIGLNKSTSCVGLASTFSIANFPLPFSAAAAACPFLCHSQQ